MAKRFRGRYTEAEIGLFRTGEYAVPYLVAEGYSQDELVGEMMNISNSGFVLIIVVELIGIVDVFRTIGIVSQK